MDNKLVTVQTFFSKQEQYLAKGMLKNNGIESYLADENIDIIIGTPIAEGYKLKVNEKDEKRAKELLKNNENNQATHHNHNYPKILVNTIATIILIGVMLISYTSLENYLKQFYNLNWFDNLSHLINFFINLVTIVSCVGIYLKKRWSWFVFLSVLLFSFISIFTIHFYYYFNENLISYTIITACILFVTIVFFIFKDVAMYFGVINRNKSIMFSVLFCGLLMLFFSNIKTDDNTKVTSSMYLSINNDTIYLNSTKYTGKLFDYYSNGQLETIGNIINGKTEGKWIGFYEDGVLSFINFYDKGLLNGRYIEYYLNGSIKTDGYYKNGDKDKNWKEYYANGNLEAKYKYSNKKLDGVSILYHFNGQKSQQENYVLGKLDGEYLSWYENGSLESKGYYKSGKKDSLWTIWANQKLYYQENFKEGKREGVAKYYDNDGIIEDEGYYKNNLKNGTWKEFDIDGNVISEKVYVNDTLIN